MAKPGPKGRQTPEQGLSGTHPKFEINLKDGMKNQFVRLFIEKISKKAYTIF